MCAVPLGQSSRLKRQSRLFQIFGMPQQCASSVLASFLRLTGATKLQAISIDKMFGLP
jgi:hypothetical protein